MTSRSPKGRDALQALRFYPEGATGIQGTVQAGTIG